jgi:hypothetical protein
MLPKKAVTANPPNSRSPFLTTSYKIISQKQPKTRVSSPYTALNSPNFNNSNRIYTQKSWRDYPLSFTILKSWGNICPEGAPAFSMLFDNQSTRSSANKRRQQVRAYLLSDLDFARKVRWEGVSPDV